MTEELLIVGTPLTVGVVASGLVELIKRSPYLPFISQGHPLANRFLLVAVCVLLQGAFIYSSGGVLDVTVLTESAIVYFAASASYIHIYKPIDRKLRNKTIKQ